MSSVCENYHQDYVRTSVQKGLINRHSLTYINFFRFVLPIIQRSNSEKILDIGSGGGTLSFYLGSLGYKVIAVEASKTAIEIAKESLRILKLEDNIQFFQSRIEDFECAGNFDLILCLEVIEHCFDDKKVLLKIYNYLRRGGVLILSTPLRNAPLVKLGLISKFDKEVGHLRRYDKSEIFTKLKMAGFIVKSHVETEGIVRNSLFVFSKLGFIVKFLRGYLSDCFTVIDDLFGKVFGYSDLIVVAEKREKADKTDRTDKKDEKDKKDKKDYGNKGNRGIKK